MNLLSVDFFSIGKGVMAIIIILFVLFVIYFVERCIFLHQSHTKPQTFMNGIKALIINGRTNEALTVCEAAHGPIPVIIKTAIVNMHKNPVNAESTIESIALLEIPLLEKRLNSIKIIAQSAPLFSFIGAASMFAKAFCDMQSAGRYFFLNDIATVVSNMLLVIICGLFLNLIATIGYSFLFGRVKRITRDIEWACNEIISFLNINKNDQKN